MIILALDGLEYKYVKEFKCKNLMQKYCGKTDISEFSEPRTVVIWSSFLAGKNLEKEILKTKNFWEFKLNPKETFFSKFKKWKAIDVPGLTYKSEKHKKERELLKKFFNGEITIREYDKAAFKHHKENKAEFFNAIKENYQVTMGYFALADTIGHLSFGVKPKMKIVYKELDKIAEKIGENNKLLIISDHGMKAVGRYGDHSNYGFWSTNFFADLDRPKITQFRKIIELCKG